MQKKERIAKLEQHLLDNPSDYQAVVSLYVAKSDQIAYEMEQRQNEKLKKIAKYRRKLAKEDEEIAKKLEKEKEEDGEQEIE